MHRKPLAHMHTNRRKFQTDSPARTIALGCALGQRLHFPLVLLLHGELGSGKTAFAQGLAQGLQVPADFTITSPSYTLINAYPGRMPFYHVDLYRLPQPADPDEIGLQEIFDEPGIVAVEWAERLDPADRPGRRLELYFAIRGDDSRSIGIIGYGLDPSDLLNGIDA